MTKNSGGNGQDLAADLLANLAEPLPFDRGSNSTNPMAALDSLSADAPHAAHVRGPALEGSFRVSPFRWRRPSLSIGLMSARVRLGPVRVQLGARIW